MGRSRVNRIDDPYDFASDDSAAYFEPKAARRRRMSKRAEAGLRAQEVNRSGSLANLEHAAKRLRSSKATKRILRVPQWDMDVAAEAMRNAGVSGVVSNLSGTKRFKVRTRKEGGPGAPHRG